MNRFPAIGPALSGPGERERTARANGTVILLFRQIPAEIPQDLLDPARMVQVAVSIGGMRQQLTYRDMLFAAATIAVVPLLLVLPLQRFSISSIMRSGVKG